MANLSRTYELSPRCTVTPQPAGLAVLWRRRHRVPQPAAGQHLLDFFLFALEELASLHFLDFFGLSLLELGLSHAFLELGGAFLFPLTYPSSFFRFEVGVPGGIEFCGLSLEFFVFWVALRVLHGVGFSG